MHKNVVIIFVTALLLFSCKNNKSYESNDIDLMYVTTTKAQLNMYEDELNSFGTITYKLKNDATPLVSGTIYNFPVKEGSYVKKGQIIAKLRNVQLEIEKEKYLANLTSSEAAYDLEKAKYSEALLSAESRLMSIEKFILNINQKELELELLKKNIEHQEELHQIGGVTDSAIETQKLQAKSSETDIKILKKELEISSLGLRKEDLIINGIEPSNDPEQLKKQIIELNTRTTFAQLKSAEASVNAAKQQIKSINMLLDELDIKAPSSGIIGAKYYESGEYIKENEKIVTIIDISSVYATVNIQENDIVNFSIGNPVSIEIPSIKEIIVSSISEVSPIADTQSGNFMIKILLNNKKELIKPGMFVKCKIQRATPVELVSIPESCLLSETNDNAKVFCVINDYVVQKLIKIKNKKNGNVWVEDGIKCNEILINNPSPLLKNGQKIQIVNEKN